MEKTLAERAAEIGEFYQNFAFPDGSEIGTWDTNAKCEILCSGLRLRGKRVLDAACMSGAASLWLESRGGAVWSFDLDERCEREFAFIKEIFAMRAQFTRASVYDVPSLYGDNHFDVLLMMGLYYHLKHPLLGLEAAWSVTDEVLLVEGEVSAVGWDAPARADFYRGAYLGDETNWWVPTVRCLEDWCWCLEGVQKVEIIYPLLVPSRAGVRVWRKTEQAS